VINEEGKGNTFESNGVVQLSGLLYRTQAFSHGAPPPPPPPQTCATLFPCLSMWNSPERHGMQIVENQTVSFSSSCCELATAAGDYKPHLGYFRVYGAFSKTSLQSRNSKCHVMIYLSANCEDDLLT
jgi:hypothetical protein